MYMTKTHKVAERIILKRYSVDFLIRYNRFIAYYSDRITIDYIINKVCIYYKITKLELCSKSRNRDIVVPRQVSMYLIKEYFKKKISLAKIGKQIGNKDHATVLHACKAINNLIDTDKQFVRELKEIKDTI